MFMMNVQDSYADLVTNVRTTGHPVDSRGMEHRELIGQAIVLNNPYYPWAHNCGRGVIDSIGWVEGLQLVAGEAFPNLMVAVSKNFERFRNGDVFHGAYGPRIRDQIPRVIERLADDPGTRQAVVTVWDPAYDLQDRADIPCTTTLQFLIRHGKLQMVTTMRSNDVWLGFPYDVFQFTLLQKTIANCLGIEAGMYIHLVGSLHLYEKDVEASLNLRRPTSRMDPQYVPGLRVPGSYSIDTLCPVKSFETIRSITADVLKSLSSLATNPITAYTGSVALNTGAESIERRINGG